MAGEGLRLKQELVSHVMELIGSCREQGLVDLSIGACGPQDGTNKCPKH